MNTDLFDRMMFSASMFVVKYVLTLELSRWFS